MSDIDEYNQSLDASAQVLSIQFQELITKKLPKAEGKVWHGHPVWFINGNPVVGLSEPSEE